MVCTTNQHFTPVLSIVAESLLASDLSKISSTFPKHFVVYAGWSPSKEERQSPEDDVSGLDHVFTDGPQKTRTAASESGILKRYQLLTPALILSLLLVFFVLVPVIILGVSSLASIQSSVRLDPPKGFSAVEKKNQ